MKESDKRRATRHQGALPVELEGGKGITRNFSSSGIFFETDQPLTAGQPIEFSIMLEHVDPAHPVRLKCQGSIVRVEESGQKIGVATSITSYSFEEFRNTEKGQGKGREPKGGGTAKK